MNPKSPLGIADAGIAAPFRGPSTGGPAQDRFACCAWVATPCATLCDARDIGLQQKAQLSSPTDSLPSRVLGMPGPAAIQRGPKPAAAQQAGGPYAACKLAASPAAQARGSPAPFHISMCHQPAMYWHSGARAAGSCSLRCQSIVWSAERQSPARRGNRAPARGRPGPCSSGPVKVPPVALPAIPV